MKSLIPIIFLFVSSSYSSNLKDGLETSDLFFKDFYLNCGSREGRFKSFEIGRSGNVKAKSGLFSNYKIIKKGEFFFLNGKKFPDLTENSDFNNLLTINEKILKKEEGKLKFIESIKIFSNNKILSMNHFSVDLEKLIFKKSKKNFPDGLAYNIKKDQQGISSGRCTKKRLKK